MDKIVGNLQSIEDQIAAQAILKAIEVLSGTDFLGYEIVIDDQRYLVVGEVRVPTRTFELTISPTLRSRSKIVTESCQVSRCGFVRYVTIRYPAKLERSAQRALIAVQHVFQKEYRYLEVRFLEEYGLLQNILFEGLEPIFAAQLDATGTPLKSAFLSVTSIVSGRYSFHLGSEQVRAALTRLCLIKDFPISPLAGVIGFVWDEAIGGFFKQNMLTDKAFMTLPFTRIVELEGLLPTNQVQNYLFGAGLSVLEIGRTEIFSFQVTCSPKDQEHIVNVLAPIKAALFEKFRENAKRYAHRREKYAALWRARKDEKPSRYQMVTAVIVEIVSKTLADIAKAGLGLQP